jgi:hypothetical protein
MSDYYTYEEKLGRKRKNRELIEKAKNVIDLEPYALSATAIREGQKRSHKLYDWYLRKGYDFDKGL